MCHAITLRADAMASPMGMRAQSAARRRYPLCENVHGRDGRARRSRCAACTPTWGSMSGSRRHPDAHRAPSPSEAAAADAESHHDVKLRPVNMPNGYIRLGPILYFFARLAARTSRYHFHLHHTVCHIWHTHTYGRCVVLVPPPPPPPHTPHTHTHTLKYHTHRARHGNIHNTRVLCVAEALRLMVMPPGPAPCALAVARAQPRARSNGGAKMRYRISSL